MADPIPAAPSLWTALKGEMPKLLSRKLLVTLTTKAGILLTAFLATKVDASLAASLVHTVVPALAGVGAAYLASQGWVDKHEVTAEAVSAEVKAGLEAKPASPPAVTG